MQAGRLIDGIETEQALMEWALQTGEALTAARTALEDADEERLDLRQRRSLESAAAAIAVVRSRLAALDEELLANAEKVIERVLTDDGPRLELAKGA